VTRVVLLGASGYLGQAVAVRLNALDPSPTVETARSIDEFRAELGPKDAILNCVGYVGSDRARLREANVKHVERVSEAARPAGARVVHISSSAVFDAIRSGDLTETTTPRARSAYGRSKLDGERRLKGLLPEACIVRPAKLFGGNDPRKRLHSLVAHVESGRALPVPVRPHLWANFVWVADAARILANLAAEPTPGTIVHLASPLPWSDFVELLSTAVGRPVRRANRALEPTLHVAAALLGRLPLNPPPRSAERLLELWDRRVFHDSRNSLDRTSVLAGLRDVTSRRRG
jgi:dTDP-4-dehydrorhamnose reductase